MTKPKDPIIPSICMKIEVREALPCEWIEDEDIEDDEETDIFEFDETNTEVGFFLMLEEGNWVVTIENSRKFMHSDHCLYNSMDGTFLVRVDVMGEHVSGFYMKKK